MGSSGLKEDIFYSSSWMQEILEISNIGLWLLEINKNNTDVRLYADDKMLELLGLQKSLSLEDNYKHFAQGVLAEDLEIVQKYIEQMLTTKRLVEVQYRWNHPWWGTIFIRCSGKLYKEDDNAYYIRGYHQNASDIEVLRQANIEKSRQLIEVVRKRDYYDELFQSVLCGIVQYRPQADGSIVFQNANMEAIRIFGYEKEAFWKRKSWRIEDLAAPEDCDRVYQIMNEILLGKGKQSFEYRALRAMVLIAGSLAAVNISIILTASVLFKVFFWILTTESRWSCLIRNCWSRIRGLRNCCARFWKEQKFSIFIIIRKNVWKLCR